MSFEQSALLIILFFLLVLLIWGRWRYDIVALAALFAAGLSGLVPQSELFTGFGNPATITVVLVLIVSFALTRSGAVDYVLPLLEPLQSKPALHISALTFLAAFLSMFMNNVGALALLMPVAISSTSQAGRAPASVLMPLSFGSILGGLVTLIGTPPNILIASYREEVTGESFSMFDFSPVGGGIAVIGIAFMLLAAPKLVRVRKQSAGLELFDVEEYLFELKPHKESEWVGQASGQLSAEMTKGGITLLSLIQSKTRYSPVPRRYQLKSSSLLIVRGSHEKVEKFAADNKLTLHSANNARQEILHSETSKIAEVVVTAKSPLLNSSARDIKFNTQYGVNLLAASRSGTPYRDRLRDFQFKVGDVLLLHGEEEQMQDAITAMNCYPLAERPLDLNKSGKALPALIIFVIAIAMVALGVLSIQLALGVATVAMAVGRIVPVREFYSGVDWPVVILLGAMIPLGTALETTGTTDLLVGAILAFAGEMSPVLILALLLIITMTVSDVLNNAATAILMAPIAYNIAISLGLNPDAFLMAIAVGASCAFLTPIGHQNNALIMGPGGYQFGDYWRMGLPLEIIIVLVALPLLLWFWPLAN